MRLTCLRRSDGLENSGLRRHPPSCWTYVCGLAVRTSAEVKQEAPTVPVIISVPKSEVTDKVFSRNGADDYVYQTLQPAYCLARVRRRPSSGALPPENFSLVTLPSLTRWK